MIIIHGLCYGQFLFCYSPNFSVKKKYVVLAELHCRDSTLGNGGCFFCTVLLLFLVLSITYA